MTAKSSLIQNRNIRGMLAFFFCRSLVPKLLFIPLVSLGPSEKAVVGPRQLLLLLPLSPAASGEEREAGGAAAGPSTLLCGSAARLPGTALLFHGGR